MPVNREMLRRVMKIKNTRGVSLKEAWAIAKKGGASKPKYKRRKRKVKAKK